MEYGAIFDMDGVLVDSSEAHFVAWRRLGEEIGTPFDRDVFRRTFGMHNNQIIPIWLQRSLSDGDLARYGARKEEVFRDLAAELTVPLPGSIPLLHSLHGDGFKIAVGSSAPRANVDLVLKMLQVESLFHAVSAGEDVSRGKPDPQVFQVAAQRLGLHPSRCIVLEDAPQGVEAGRRAGMAVVALTSSRSKEELSAANLVVDSLEGIEPASLRRLVG